MLNWMCFNLNEEFLRSGNVTCFAFPAKDFFGLKSNCTYVGVCGRDIRIRTLRIGNPLTLNVLKYLFFQGVHPFCRQGGISSGLHKTTYLITYYLSFPRRRLLCTCRVCS